MYVPVFSNRSIETTASLLDASGNVLRRFRVRTRGQLASDGFPINQVRTLLHCSAEGRANADARLVAAF